jgi:nucleoside-diphosphate-sugar epimerase
MSRSPFESSVNKATPGLLPAPASDDRERAGARNGRRDILIGARQRSDTYLPIVLERLRRTVVTWRIGRRISLSTTAAATTAARTNGGGLVDLDPLVALAAELTSHPADGSGFNGARHEIRSGSTYLVTGCAGFIGSHLVEALCARGCSVVGVDAFTDNYSRAAKERNLAQCSRTGDVRFLERDLAETPLEPLFEGVDGVFHLAGRPGVRTSWGSTFAAYLHDNLLATQRVFEAAVRQEIRVVYASSSSVYGDVRAYPLREDTALFPVSPYGVSKLGCEALATAYTLSRGLDAIGLRYFSVYGPRQRPDMAFSRVLGCLAKNRPFGVLGSGRQTRDFTYVGDVVSATLAAMERAASGRVYNVGGGCEISLLDSLALCAEIAGRKIDLRHIPAAVGDVRRTIADAGRACAELGWRPTTSLESGLIAQISAAAELEPGRPVAWVGQA